MVIHRYYSFDTLIKVSSSSSSSCERLNREIQCLFYIITKGNIIINHYLFLGHYQAIGRVIHLNHLKELLQKQKSLDFDATRKNMDNLVPQLDILADTLYLEVLFVFYNFVHISFLYHRDLSKNKQQNP